LVCHGGSTPFADNHHARRNAYAQAKLLEHRCQAFNVFDKVEPRANGTFRIVLAGHRISEICEDAVALVLSDYAAGRLDDFCRSALIGREDVTKALRIKALGERHRLHEVTEHYAKLPVLGAEA